MASFGAFQCSSQKLPSAGGVYVFVMKSHFVFPHYGCHVTFHSSFYVTLLQFHFVSNILWHPFYVRSVTQQFIVLICKLLHKTELKTVLLV
jgi:hypothetical protein